MYSKMDGVDNKNIECFLALRHLDFCVMFFISLIFFPSLSVGAVHTALNITKFIFILLPYNHNSIPFFYLSKPQNHKCNSTK